ncbi:MAG: saccharopine dehydrogenase NADP-binding domain-containing protein [Cohaesibacter sp.]|nr:saccharopine dehydrogenase NADP-binding domain-containing protein [Cohaesibacter sp.]
MAHIHWLGAGLASKPGIRRLIKNGHALTLWERDLEKAQEAVGDLRATYQTYQIREAVEGALEGVIAAGDVVVSMLPAPLHPVIAKLCLQKSAHFISSSYIGPDMQALHEEAKGKGLSFVNEMGLDPGIDHLYAHLLMQDYKASGLFDKKNDHEFRSYCGGFPAVANDFKYKFSWSPLGVLKALASPAKALLKGKIIQIEKPWEAVEDYWVQSMTGAEKFQSYPNRDSLPFMQDYGFEDDWIVSHFVRGTLRLDGWARAWQDIFKVISAANHPKGESELTSLSDRLWVDHAYQPNEADRVVLAVELKVKKDGKTIWHQSKLLDSFGNEQDSAMGRLVSIPVSLATEAVLAGHLGAGVQPAPSKRALILPWLEELARHHDHTQHIDHLNLANHLAAE